MSRRSSPRVRATAALLAASVALTFSGVVALVFLPQTASAGVAPGIAPDFVVGPGETAPQTFDNTLVGSVEAKGTPSDCRTSPVYKLTCAAHRLKLTDISDKSYQLRIILEWDAQLADVLSVPDVDMFLFDGPESQFDSTAIGGAGGTMPEQATITPTQTEYDIVVQAYAGALTNYKITVSYTNSSALQAGSVTPDIVLTPKAPPFVKEYQSVIAAGAPAVLWLPEGCRTGPEYDFLCDVYRIKLNRSKAKGATNFVVLTLDWDAVIIPGLAAAVVGLRERPVPDLNFYVYDSADHALEGVGGVTLDGVPERLGFVGTQDEYDLVVQSAGGAGTSYKLSAFMTDEIFDKPFELLDPLTGQTLRQEPDGSLVPVTAPTDNAPSIPSLGLAPIDIDDQIAGIGLGTTEQFDVEEALRLGQEALRNTSITSEPPSGVVLLLAMVVVPLGLLAVSVWVMRRRHHVAF